MSTTVCPPYSITDGSYTNCGPLILCPGNSITIDGCGTCTGDQELGLSFGSMTVSSDNGCGDDSLCAKLAYTVPDSATACEQDYIKEYCSVGTTTCGGTVTYTITQITPSYMYAEYYEDTACSSNTASGSVVEKLQCSPVGDSGYYAEIGCTGTLDTSPWTAFIYSDSTCTIAYSAAIVGADSCDCQPLSAANIPDATYSMRVNCAGTAPTCGTSVTDDPNSGTDDGTGGGTDDTAAHTDGGGSSSPKIDGSSGLFIGVVVSACVVFLIVVIASIAFCWSRKKNTALAKSEFDRAACAPAV